MNYKIHINYFLCLDKQYYYFLHVDIVVYLDNGDVIVKIQDSKTKESYPQFSYDSQGNHKNFIEKLYEEDCIKQKEDGFSLTDKGFFVSNYIISQCIIKNTWILS